jgi:antirestriction protein ArdC
MPEANRFTTREEYYSTLFHEYAHSTGHESRLNREFGKTFGNHSYSQEELVAELTAAMVCGRAGIATRTIENSAAYVRSWLKNLDPKMLVHATRAARKAYSIIVPSAAELETSNREAA